MNQALLNNVLDAQLEVVKDMISTRPELKGSIAYVDSRVTVPLVRELGIALLTELNSHDELVVRSFWNTDLMKAEKSYFLRKRDGDLRPFAATIVH